MTHGPDGQWQPLGSPAPNTLADARLQLHWASQPLASFGESWAEHREDYRHRAMVWEDDFDGLVSFASTSGAGLRLGLDPARLALVLLREGAPVDELALAGHTLDDAFRWLARSVSEAGSDDPAGLTRLPTDRIPAHPLGQGEPFSTGDPAARAEVARWFSNLSPLLERVRAENDDASPVLCWPHHFDLATLVVLDPHLDPEEARSVGVGVVPGDESYAVPYLYVVPWPPPADPVLPGLGGGAHWHGEGWLGAVLEAGALVRAGSEQRSVAARFVGEAVRACRGLLSD